MAAPTFSAMRTEGTSYVETISAFAAHGAGIIRLDPARHYQYLRPRHRALEPGFIPIDRPPILTSISHYPNETELTSSEAVRSATSFRLWGERGDAAAYERAYHDWHSFREEIPFFRKWEAPLYAALDIEPHETAWLPMIKCPLPAGSNLDKLDPDGIDEGRDLGLLWDQLNILKPALILVQGAGVYGRLGNRLDNLKFVRTHPMQKTPQQPTNAMKIEQLEKLTRALEPYVATLRAERAK